MKLNASISASELPINSRMGFISSILISLNLSLESLFIRYPTIQTLPHQYAQLYFCLIEPASMLGCVVKFQLLQHTSCLRWLKRLVHRCFGMCVKIIHHYTYQFSLRVAFIYQPLHPIRKIILPPMLSHFNVTPACLRFTQHEKVACAVALVLIIKAFNLPGHWWQSLANLLNQLLACFVKVYFRSLRVINVRLFK